MTTTPATQLFELTAKAQELLPDHTFKAVSHRAANLETTEEQNELWEEVLGKFERGLNALTEAMNRREKGR